MLLEPENRTLESPRIGSARNLARDLLKKCRYKEPPVLLNDIINLLKKEYQLRIQSWDFGENISGILIVEKDFSAIGYNDKQHVHRNRFTVAHEIGHLLFNHTCNKNYAGLEDCRAYEIEANHFATELLLPLKFLKEDLHSGIKEFSVLADRYWVSEEALGWRIADPGLRLLNLL